MTDPQDPFAPPPPGSSPTPPGAPPPPPPGAPRYGEPLPAGAPAGRARNGLGTASLVVGLVSFCGLFVFVLPPVLAVVLGALGRGRARRQEATNGGVALAGLITGLVGLVLGVALWVFVLANLDTFQRFSDCADSARGNDAAEQVCTDQLTHDLFGTTALRERER